MSFLFVPQDLQTAPIGHLTVPKIAMNEKKEQLEKSLT